MATRERPADRGRRRGEQLTRELVDAFRLGRVSRGLSQVAVGRAIGLSDSEISRIERGDRGDIPIGLMAELLAVVGLELSARAYPGGTGIRDAAQVALLERLRAVASPSFQWQTEVPIQGADLRAWDAVLAIPRVRIGVEAETRIRDLQAVQRRINLKLRDSGFERALLLAADTRSNRTIMREFGDAISTAFPVPPSVAIRMVRTGRDPGGHAVLLL